MASTQTNAINSFFTNNTDGFTFGGGSTTLRKLLLQNGNVNIYGSGTNNYFGLSGSAFTPVNRFQINAATTNDTLAEAFIGASATTQKCLVLQSKQGVVQPFTTVLDIQNSAGTSYFSVGDGVVINCASSYGYALTVAASSSKVAVGISWTTAYRAITMTASAAPSGIATQFYNQGYGNWASGSGLGTLYEFKNASGTFRQFHHNYVMMSNATNAAEQGAMVWENMVAGAAKAEVMRIDGNRLSLTGGAGTARLHLPAGTATASTAPLKFTSGTSLTTAEAGAVEFTTDDFYLTITTSAARKGIVLNDGANLTSGKYPKASTNGRLIDGPTPLAGTKVYYVSDSSGGAVDRKLTFTDGILTAET